MDIYTAAAIGLLVLAGILVWVLLDSRPGQVKIPGKGPDGWGGSYKKSMSQGQARRAGMTDLWKPDGMTLGGLAPGHDVQPARKSEGTGFLWGFALCLILVVGALVFFT